MFGKLSDEAQAGVTVAIFEIIMFSSGLYFTCSIIFCLILYISKLNQRYKKRIKSYQKFCAKISQKSLDNKYKL